MKSLVCAGVAETEALGERIGRLLAPGTILAFRGGLGAGKTAMCRGIARGLGVTVPVTSPSYTLINEYEGKLPFYHFDAYRLLSAEDFMQLDPDRYFYGDGVCAVEWSERVHEAIPASAITIELEPREDGSRLITISGEALERHMS